MLFNTIEFLIFLPIVFILYWFVLNKSLAHQNSLILLASYIFYGWWDYRFLSLIFISTIIDYKIGLSIQKQNTHKKKKLLLYCSVLFNLILLGFFKYYNFFIESWTDLFTSLGYNINSNLTLKIILPVGISFYTFQTMSYTIDIYCKKLQPTKDFISFAAFVSFFPQLVAGPIERASNLLPQVLSKRKFKYAQGVQGLRLIIWGMFKKVVIADSLSPIVDNIFNNYQDLGGGILWLGAIYFAFQIYCDFSGYSDIAIGTSKLFGFEIMSNFKFPYFSKNIGQFWRRWHISLSTWFRDYLYIPLGGSKNGPWLSIRNVFIIFLVSGFWHGAYWTFIVWGLFHSILFLPTFIFNLNQKSSILIINKINFLTTPKKIFQVGSTFLLITVGWVFFRSETVVDSFNYLNIMLFHIDFPDQHRSPLLYYILPLIVFDFYFKKDERNIHQNKSSPIIDFIMLFFIFLKFGLNSNFVYFQF